MKFPIPIYGGEVWVFKTKSEFLEAQEELGDDAEIIENSLGDSWVVPSLDSPNEWIYLVGVYDKELGTLVHELSHTALNIVANSNFLAHDGNGEPFSYLLNYLFDKTYIWFTTELTVEN